MYVVKGMRMAMAMGQETGDRGQGTQKAGIWGGLVFIVIASKHIFNQVFAQILSEINS